MQLENEKSQPAAVLLHRSDCGERQAVRRQPGSTADPPRLEKEGFTVPVPRIYKRFNYFTSVLLGLALAIVGHTHSNAEETAATSDVNPDESFWLGGVNWDAVGKLSFPDGSYCTGTLVTSKIVVTAAHCLFDENNQMSDKEISFQAGFHLSKFKTASPVVNTVIPEEFDIAASYEGNTVDGFDYAFLVLEWPLGDRTGYLQFHRMANLNVKLSENLLDAGFGDVGFQLTASLGCTLTYVFDDNTFEHNCLIVSGDSGGPVFLFRKEGIYMIGINSYTYSDDRTGEKLAIAVSAEAFAENLAKLIRESDSPDQVSGRPVGGGAAPETGEVLRPQAAQQQKP